MKPNSIFNISGGIVKIDEVNIYNNDNGRHAQDEEETADDDDPVETTEVEPAHKSPTDIGQPNMKHKTPPLTFIDCIAEKKTAHILRQWLHLMMDNKDKPKQKLKYLRAISEAGLFSETPDYNIYVSEFGKISRSSYYDWMQGELRYDLGEINKLIEQYSIFLGQFQK